MKALSGSVGYKMPKYVHQIELVDSFAAMGLGKAAIGKTAARLVRRDLKRRKASVDRGIQPILSSSGFRSGWIDEAACLMKDSSARSFSRISPIAADAVGDPARFLGRRPSRRWRALDVIGTVAICEHALERVRGGIGLKDAGDAARNHAGEEAADIGVGIVEEGVVTQCLAAARRFVA